MYIDKKVKNNFPILMYNGSVKDNASWHLNNQYLRDQNS